MAVVLCSVNDKKNHKGKAYCTAVKDMYYVSNKDEGYVKKAYEKIVCLVPTWDLVKGYKWGGMSEEWYTDGYRKLLASRWSDVKAWLDRLKPDNDITLMCFCREGEFCHRRLIGKMIAKWRKDLEIIVH